MANIYLIRHCESEGNACRRTQAQTDALVTAKGYLQCQALLRRFRGVPIHRLYSSDAFRSITTLEPIARERGLTIRVSIHLREVTTGIWEDMAWGNIARDYPEQFRSWDEHPWDHITPGATTFLQAAQRVAFFLRRVAREVGEEGTALCVSHSCAIKAALCLLTGRPLSQVGEVGHGDNTAVSLLHIDGQGAVTAEYMNDDSHLPSHLRRAWSGVAGADVNMAVDPAILPRDEETLLALARMEAEQRGADFDAAQWLARARALLERHPDHLALCRLRGEPVGFVLMSRPEELPACCGQVETMFVLPRLQGLGYTEQLFGYAAHTFRYEGLTALAIHRPILPEQARVAERFLFAPMPGFEDRLVLELFSPPCPYPILA